MYDCAISIIIPTYRPKSYIYDCLFSIKNQSFPKELFEIIVILNGDKEPYYTDIETFIKNEFATHHVHLVYSAAKGVSNARNIGIEKSKGEYIAFIDDDDIISDEYLNEMYCIAKKDIMPLSYCRVFETNILDNTGDYITNLYTGSVNKKIYIMNVRSYFSICWGKLISRDIIGNERFNRKFQNGEDSLFMFSISDKIKRIKLTSRDCVYYRRLRKYSLHLRKRSLVDRVNNFIGLFFSYTIVFLRKPLKYNFLFYVSRILAYFKTMGIIL
jgi:glycosyltransferase involved in cell wall biosynthesis